MRKPGRPLQFLMGVLGGWVVLRATALIAPLYLHAAAPIAAPEQSLRAQVSAPAMASLSARSVETAMAADEASFVGVHPVPRESRSGRSRGASTPDGRGLPPLPGSTGPMAVPQPDAEAARAIGNTPPAIIAAATGETAARSPVSSPWSVTGWVLWRPDVIGSLAQGPLLGGSQAGVRLDYRLWGDGGRSLALYGRVTRAIERPFAEEAAFGVAVRPVRGLPVSIMAERRQRLGNGGRDGFALLAAGGIGPRPIAERVEIEGYAQAGVVGLPGADGFADGKASLAYKITKPDTQPDLAIGASLSGSAQPGASRLDIGPEVRVRLPVADGHLRLSAEWRERIAGDARPASGPAITLVADF